MKTQNLADFTGCQSNMGCFLFWAEIVRIFLVLVVWAYQMLKILFWKYFWNFVRLNFKSTIFYNVNKICFLSHVENFVI